MTQIPCLLKYIWNFRSFQNLISDVYFRRIHMSGFLLEKVSFKLSDIGEGIKEVTVKEWFVKVGDKVSQFDKLCEVQSDKASVTITSRYDGIISKLYYNVDDIALVGQPLVDIENDEESYKQSEECVKANKNSKQNISANETNNKSISLSECHSFDQNEKEILCIPSVRRLAKEYQIDLSKIIGTGKNGRILKENVLMYLENSNEQISDADKVLSTVTTSTVKTQISGFKKAMLKSMTESLKIPHFVYSDELKVTQLNKLRNELKNKQGIENPKITLLPFFIKAVSNALERYPIINSSLDEKCDSIIFHKNHNIGIAMDTKLGLAVPVLKSVEKKTVVEIVKELNELIERGRSGVLSQNDLSGATFTISNIGIIGGTYTKPVILPPQVAIITLGITQLVPRFDDSGNIIAEEIINVSASADHRIIDGVTMAKFIQILKKQIEKPYLLFLNL